jgi:hypothetical protein
VPPSSNISATESSTPRTNILTDFSTSHQFRSQCVMGSFNYEPLDLSEQSFRLLRLYGGDESHIKCEIFEAWLHGDGTIPFEALSYAWGSLDTPHTIELNGKRLAITTNLYNALHNIRVEDEDRILWVDAICINQKDERERGHQVAQMSDIYSRAEQVIFWLGHATPEINIVMSALKRLERRCQKEPCSNWLLSDERWRKLWLETRPNRREAWYERQRCGFEELTQRPWFKRVWILQEVASARRAVVCAGSLQVGSRIFALGPTLVDVKPDSRCQAVLDIMPGPSRQSSWWGQKRDLYTLLQRFRHSQASDPRDMIYALLGISSNEAGAYNLVPDYTKTTEQVIDDTTSFLFGLPPCAFRTMDTFLDHLTFLTAQAFVALARSSDGTDVYNFIQDRGHHVSIGTTELVAAAANRQFGGEVMEILFMQPEVFIAEPVIAAAIKNTACGEEILYYLLERPDRRIKKLVIDLVVNAAVLNIGCGQDFYKRLAFHHDHHVRMITKIAIMHDSSAVMEINSPSTKNNYLPQLYMLRT